MSDTERAGATASRRATAAGRRDLARGSAGFAVPLVRRLVSRRRPASPAAVPRRAAAEGTKKKATEGRKRYAARAELVLARDDRHALRDVPLEPDPLTPIARTFSTLRDDRGERAEVHVDLVPVTPAVRQRRRARLVRDEERRSKGAGGGWRTALLGELSGGGGAGPGAGASAWWAAAAGFAPPAAKGRRAQAPAAAARPSALSLLEARTRTKALGDKCFSAEAAFHVQVLVRVESEAKGRPQAVLKALLAAFEAFASAENHWKVAGLRVGTFHLASDAPWRRGRFDRRFDRGAFEPAKDQVVTASEVAGLLKPPTAHCRVATVERSGGVVPAPPQDLPVFAKQPDVLPLGFVGGPDGPKPVGVHVEDTFFWYMSGRSRYGKALAVDTPIPTPTGWTTMGALQVGDAVFDEAGRPCRVTDATGVAVGRDCYEVVFSDGSVIVADAEHRWATTTAAARRENPPAAGGGAGARVVTTAEIAATLRCRDGRANHAVAVAGALELPEATLPQEPYAVGYGLGNAGAGRVPPAYQRASAPQRLALLRGLMDSGGVAFAGGQCSFSCATEALAADVHEVVSGLGMKATAAPDAPWSGARHPGDPCWRVLFAPGPGTTAVFRSPSSSAEAARPGSAAAAATADASPAGLRHVVGVRPVPSVPVRCVAVDAPGRLYLAGRSFVPTHNTEVAINQFLHAVRSGHGGFFLDPHQDGLERIKPYLTDLAPGRVVEVSLASKGPLQAGWNLFSMRGLGPDDVERRVSAVVDSFASALRWGEVNNRALTLTTMSAQALCELALALPPELAPTIFQVPTLLSNAEWRRSVVPCLSATTRDYFANRFDGLPPDAVLPVTNLIDRMRSSGAVSALFGSSTSSYDVRRCMDEGKVVLACPAGVGDKDRLVANFMVYDVLQAAVSRKDTDPRRRRPFYLWFDEVQVYDGASRGNLAALLEQCAKYGVRAFLMNQNPERLTGPTWDAVSTNRSHLASTVVGAQAAARIAREWQGAVRPETIGRLDRFTYLAGVTLRGKSQPPFLVRGFSVEELWADVCHPERVPDLDRAIDANLSRRPAAETRDALATLDQRIADHLARRPPVAPPPAAAASWGPAAVPTGSVWGDADPDDDDDDDRPGDDAEPGGGPRRRRGGGRGARGR